MNTSRSGASRTSITVAASRGTSRAAGSRRAAYDRPCASPAGVHLGQPPLQVSPFVVGARLRRPRRGTRSRPRRAGRRGAAGRRASPTASGSRRARPTRSSSSTSASPTSGPSAIATAIARFSATTGVGIQRQQLVVVRDDPRPVGVRGVGRGHVAPRDRGLHLVRRRATRRRAAASSSATPSAIAASVPPRPVLLLERHEVAGAVDPGVAPGVVQQHQREQARRLGLVGHQRRPAPGRAGSPRPRAGGA